MRAPDYGTVVRSLLVREAKLLVFLHKKIRQGKKGRLSVGAHKMIDTWFATLWTILYPAVPKSTRHNYDGPKTTDENPGLICPDIMVHLLINRKFRIA